MWNGAEHFRPSGTPVFGIHPAEVIDNNDTELTNSGRVKVRVWPFYKGLDVSVLPWAAPAFPVWAGAGANQGAFAVPAIGSRVYVFFSAGDVTTPIYFAEAPSATDGPSGKTKDVRILKTPAGHIIKVDDTGNTIEIEHSSGVKVKLEASGKVAIGTSSQELLDLVEQTLTALEQSTVPTQLGPQQLSKVTDGTVTTIKTNLGTIKGTI